MISIRKKIKSVPESLKATIVFALASFATSGINYITTPIFTRLLTNEQYGTVAVYNSWYAIIRVFASLTLIFPGILNVGLYEHKSNRWGYLSSALGLTTISTAIISVVCVLFSGEIANLLSLPSSLITLILLMCFTQPATTFWTFKQRYEYRYKETFFVSVGTALLAQIVSVVMVVWCKSGGNNNLDSIRLWSAGLVNIIVGLVIYIYICKKGKNFFDKCIWKQTIIIAVPLIPHYLGSELLSSIDKIMISKMVGNDKAGIYALAAVLSSIGVLLWRALNIMFAPFVNEMLGKKDFERIRKNVKPLLVVAGMLCVIASLASPELIGMLATKNYLDGIYIVPPIAASVFLHALYDVYSSVSFFYKKSFYIMLATVITAIVNVVLNYIFIFFWGYIAAAYTTLISNIILVFMHYLNARIIEKERVFDGKLSVLLGMSVIILCAGCNLVFDYSIIRYFLIIVIIVLLFLYFKVFIKAITDMKV